MLLFRFTSETWSTNPAASKIKEINTSFISVDQINFQEDKY